MHSIEPLRNTLAVYSKAYNTLQWITSEVHVSHEWAISGKGEGRQVQSLLTRFITQDLDLNDYICYFNLHNEDMYT